MKISVVSGGFDPIHSGHINYLKDASSKGEKLIVCLNSDEWLSKKKGKFFMPFEERKIILENLSFVSEVIQFEDDILGSCINGLKKIQNQYPNDTIVFCNGGDRELDNIPESIIDNIELEFGVGGIYKKNSSSDILKNWESPSVQRRWGIYKTFFEKKGIKIKELLVSPGSGMSFQKHQYRNEFWFIYEGSCKVFYSESTPDNKKEITLNKDDSFFVKASSWHQITNPSDTICRIIEIQYGSKVSEDDIERLYYYQGS